jgi:hypothetical protein
MLLYGDDRRCLSAKRSCLRPRSRVGGRCVASALSRCGERAISADVLLCQGCRPGRGAAHMPLPVRSMDGGTGKDCAGDHRADRRYPDPPRLLNYIVAIYPILIGLAGLFGQFGGFQGLRSSTVARICKSPGPV